MRDKQKIWDNKEGISEMDTKYQCKAEMEQNDKLGVKIGGMGSAAGERKVSEQGHAPELVKSLEELYKHSSRSNKRIAKWLLDNPGSALELSLDELAAVTGSSRSTVVRFCKALGVEGFRELKRQLVRPLAQDTRSLANDEVVEFAFELTHAAVRETLLNFDYAEFTKAVELCAAAQYLLWFGSTESGWLAQCASHKCGLLGIKSRVFVDYGSFMAQSTLVSPEDVFIAVSWGGDGEHLRRPVLMAKELGLPIVGITAERFSWLADTATACLVAGNKCVSKENRLVTIRAGQEVLMNLLVLKTARARGIEWQRR